MMENRVKELRIAKGFTQEQLAEMCETSKQTIQRLESGSRQLNNKWIERISKALDVEPSQLFRKTKILPALDRAISKLSESKQRALVQIAQALEED